MKTLVEYDPVPPPKMPHSIVKCSSLGPHLRIAWFIHRYSPVVGGSENFARAIVSRFVARGDSVDVFTSDADDLTYFTHRNGGKVEAPRFSEVDGATVHRIQVRHIPAQRYVGKALSLLPSWHLRCQVGSYLPILPDLLGDSEYGSGTGSRTQKYDLAVGVAFPYTNFSYAAWKLARWSGCPFVVIPFLHLGSKGYTLPHQIRLLKQADLVVAVTPFEANAMAELGLDRSKITILPMAFEAEKVTGGDRVRLRKQLGIGLEESLIGQVGALDYNKGTEHLVEAVSRLNADRDGPIHLILAGRPTPGFERFLTGRNDWPSWLHVLGPFENALLPDLYAAIDVYAMPSRTDSFGIVFLEAWANGKPVVAAAAGGVSDVVRDEVDGLLVPFGDVPRLEHALNRVVIDKTFANTLGGAGRAKLAQGWTWDDRFEQFRQVIAGPGANARRLIGENGSSAHRV